MSKHPILIVCPTVAEWKQYCGEQDYDPRQTVLIRGLIQILGYLGADVHYAGRYWQIADLARIAEYCRGHGMAVPPEGTPHAN